MISMSFVKGDNPSINGNAYEIDYFANESMNYVTSIADDFLTKESLYMYEHAIEGKDYRVDERLYTEGKNIFETIGEKVIAVCKKVVEFIKNIIEKIKGASFKNKSNVDKINIFVKKYGKRNPVLRDDVVYHYKKGDLDVTDVKSLKEMKDAYDNLIAMSSKYNDPNTLRGKAKLFIKGLSTTTTAAVATVGGVAGLVVTLQQIKKNNIQMKNDSNEVAKKIESIKKENDKLQKDNDRLKKGNDRLKDENYKLRKKIKNMPESTEDLDSNAVMYNEAASPKTNVENMKIISQATIAYQNWLARRSSKSFSLYMSISKFIENIYNRSKAWEESNAQATTTNETDNK